MEHTTEARRIAIEAMLMLAGNLSSDDMADVLRGHSPHEFADFNQYLLDAFADLRERDAHMPGDVDDGVCTQAEADADFALMDAAADLVASDPAGVFADAVAELVEVNRTVWAATPDDPESRQFAARVDRLQAVRKLAGR